MKNIITAAQTREADRHTIEKTGISSIDLMEKAARRLFRHVEDSIRDKNRPILICCGPGNNGGDGVALARMLRRNMHGAFKLITVWIARFSGRESEDFTANLKRLNSLAIKVIDLPPGKDFPAVPENAVVIDALLGSGLNKPLAGDWLRLANHLNEAGRHTIAVDVPTGMRADGYLAEHETAVYCHGVISFQRPKISFFFPESVRFMAGFNIVDIGLDESFIEGLPSDFKLIEQSDIRQIHRPRKPFDHKGTYGHALIVAGSYRTMGAALLSCEACVYSGAGRTSAKIPKEGLITLNTRCPEVMYTWDIESPTYNAIGVGPGLGLNEDTYQTLRSLLKNVSSPMVVDADAISMIARYKRLFKKLPEGSILTPHMKEFDTLFGKHATWWDRIQTARKEALARKLVVVLKNRYTFIAAPDGRVYINPTGNPAMASGGMGDVLTGILTALLAQGYPPTDAAILGCYLHGAAGDRLAAEGMAVVTPGALVKAIPVTISTITASKYHDTTD